MNINTFKGAIALTGSISTGKSTVSKILKESGFSIIDADLIAHKLLDLHSSSIIALFGEEFVKDGVVLRKRLGKLIFSNKKEKEKLEKFIHPLIKEEIINEAERIQKKEKIYFIDIPLFFENMKYDISKCLVVYTNKQLQIVRLMNRDKIDEKEALLKISNQIDIEVKKQKADYLIDNTKDFEHLRLDVQRFIKEIK